jgi:hypothetical protein
MIIGTLDDFYQLRKTETAVLLGSGSSIARITMKEWAAISTYDTWTTNNWVYHPFFVPDFYMVETKWYGFDILQRRFKEKWDAYKQRTNFLFMYGKRIRLRDGRRPYLRDVVPDDAKRYEFSAIPRDAKRTHKPFNANYQPKPHCLTKSYDMSMTMVFELLHKMDYARIILYGIDLHDSLYFWSDGDPKYGEVHHRWNKEHENKDPKSPHATHRIKDFILDVNDRWMEPRDREIFVGHDDTMLFPKLRKVSICEGLD